MDITNLDDHRKVWKTNAAACAACGHEWQAVYPVGAEDVGLECPACGSGLGSVLPNKDIVDELFDLGGSMQQCIIHGKAIVEIERLREDKAELLKALTNLYKSCRWEKVCPTIDAAKDAIAKATGEE